MSSFPIHIMINPHASHGKAARKSARLIAEICSARQDTAVIETETPALARDYILSLDHQPATVVAVGGDGTVNRIGNALLGTPHQFAIIPAGTGNDFATLMGLHNGNTALQSILHGTPKLYDTGLVTWTDTQGTHSHAFLNALGIGFDAAVAGRMKSASAGSGILPYLVNVLRELRALRQRDAAITIENEKLERRLFLMTVGNGVSSGGGFKITPHAVPDDGMLDICIVSGVTKLRVLRVLPETFWGGHLRHREIEYYRTTSAEVAVPTGTPIHTDGEYLSGDATGIRVEIRPASLAVLLDNRIIST